MNIFQKKLVLVFSVLFLFSTQSIYAQKKLRSGAVIYEITDVSTSVPELKLMKGTKTVLYFTPEKQKVDVSLNNEAIKIQTYYNNKNDEVTMMYDFMGKHFQVNSNYKESKKIKPYVKNISYQKSKTKTIAGYECYKAEITFEDEKVVIWVTDKIKLNSPDFQRLFPGLEGFPLEYVRRGENIKMTFKAKVINEIISNKIFDLPEGYEKISDKDFKERMGGMTFGF